MKNKLAFICFLNLITVICGCSVSSERRCKPVLFPYSEYGYKALTEELAGSFTRDISQKPIDLFGLKWELPQGWSYRQSSNSAAKITLDDGRFFLLIYQKDRTFTDDASDVHFVGCDNFTKSKDPVTIRSHKDFTSAVYLFTDEDLQGEPTFWQYYVLWTKTKQLQGATKLLHLKGKKIEAFQMNSDTGALCGQSEVVCKIEIFPDKIAPASVTIAASFTDDALFARILDMLDTLNP